MLRLGLSPRLAFAFVLGAAAAFSNPSVAAASVVQSISAGEYHSCELLEAGGIACWGNNSSGELGDGTTTNRTSPVAVSGISDTTALANGGEHTCALVSGAVECWGANSDGQLGDGTTTGSDAPVSVSGITTATAVASGAYSYSTCALISDGTAKCWGYNAYGQLGDGTETNSDSPVGVSGLTGISQISIDEVFACALISDGTVKCWGYDWDGELGNGSYYTSPSTTPVAVSNISNATQISVGSHHACALLSDGTVKCWGSNYSGESGTTGVIVPTPTTVSGISNAVFVSAGDTHSCAVLSDGSVKCWGSNSYGQLGDGTTTDSHTPVTVSGISTATQVATGYLHSCALLSSDAVKCWGYNGDGELGDGTTTNSSVPVLVAPANDTPPTLSGNPTESVSVTANPGTWAGGSATFTYQWKRCDSDGGSCADITGATSYAYTPTSSDRDSTLRVYVTATTDSGSSTASSTFHPVLDLWNNRYGGRYLNTSFPDGGLDGTSASVTVNDISLPTATCLAFRTDVEAFDQDLAGSLLQVMVNECGSGTTSYDCGVEDGTVNLSDEEYLGSGVYDCHVEASASLGTEYVLSVHKTSDGNWYPFVNGVQLTDAYTEFPDATSLTFMEGGEHVIPGSITDDCTGWSGSATYAGDSAEPLKTYSLSSDSWTSVSSLDSTFTTDGCWNVSGGPPGSFTISHS